MNTGEVNRTQASGPRIIKCAGDLLSRYDVLFCDVWGVVHNGVRSFRSACDALVEFRARNGTVILVSNAPVPEGRVARMLRAMDVPREAWDGIVTSGTIAINYVSEKAYRTIHAIGPRERDRAFFDRVEAQQTSIDGAEAIVCTGLNDEFNETAESYTPLLEKALARRLTFVCANPDVVVDVGGTLYLCAGAIAEHYQKMGGDVLWAGKPHASAYNSALALAEKKRDAEVARSRVLAIGDSLRTDIAGANAAGIDALFVATGIHREDVTRGDTLAASDVARLFDGTGATALVAMSELRW